MHSHAYSYRDETTMSISADEFHELEEQEESLPDEGTNPFKILLFLLRNHTHAFKQTVLAEELGISLGSVGPSLHRLEQKGLVRHAEPYWMIGDDDRIGGIAASMGTFQAIDDERYGPAPDKDEWMEHAELPEDR